MQQEWIENLIEQNEMLVRAVGELEVEATERVHMLEEKLQRSAQCICEVNINRNSLFFNIKIFISLPSRAFISLKKL